MNGAPIVLALTAALAAASALSRRGSRAPVHGSKERREGAGVLRRGDDTSETLYHGGPNEVRSPRAGTFLTPDLETAITYARYGPNQHRRTPQAGNVSSYIMAPGTLIQRFDSFAAAYAHYGVRSTSALAAAAVLRQEADVVAVYNERIIVRPATIRWTATDPVEAIDPVKEATP